MNFTSIVAGSPLRRLLTAWASAHASGFEQRDPLAAQRETLKYLMSRGVNTRFGRDHGLGDFAGLMFPDLYSIFRKRVPIRTYSDFWEEYFSKGFQSDGEFRRLTLIDATWPGKIPFFCETSGTTAPTKFIPFSREMFAANQKAARDLAACYLARNRSSRLFPGKLLYMAGNTQLNDLGNGVQSGDMSAITLLHPPAYLKPFVLPDPSVSALPWDEKLTAMAQLLLQDQAISAISGVPPWILLLLKRCVEIVGRPLPEIIPNLELIIHGGTSMKPYKKEFASLFGSKVPNFLELLPSSEAFMAFQFLGEEQMRLTPYYGVFFEFVPFEDLDERGVPRPDAEAVPLEEIQVGRRYSILLTTCAGLWRYHIGDTIRFVSVAPIMIEFTGRDRFLDRFEEKVTQGEVEEAVAALNELNGIEIKEFIVGPDIEARRHVWVLAAGNRCHLSPNHLAHLLDSRLRLLNSDYHTFRSQGRITSPKVMVVDDTTIYRWSREVRGKLGGQSKIPHIDPTMDGGMMQSLVNFVDRERGGMEFSTTPYAGELALTTE